MEEGDRTDGELIKGKLTIGYGTGGGQPQAFFLRDDQDKLDVGFIKLFISTVTVDLSAIAQHSPWQPARDAKEKHEPPVAIWDTVTIAVVQHKPPQ